MRNNNIYGCGTILAIITAIVFAIGGNPGFLLYLLGFYGIGMALAGIARFFDSKNK